MPELPEVELMSRNLHRWTAGKRLGRPELFDPKLLQRGDLDRLAGHRVRRCWRRGKYSVLETEDGPVLVLHYRMTGHIVPGDGASRPWIRLRLPVQGGQTLLFDDSRRLGCAWVLDRDELDAFFTAQDLGPEPWPEPRDAAFWKARLGGARTRIKQALMDQSRVAGLGNIAASESCFRAGIDPRTPVRLLGDAQWEALAKAVPAWIEATLAAEEGDEITYVNAGGDNPFLVYAREGEPCPRCRTRIQRIVQSGRSSFFCPRCQPPAAEAGR